MRLLFVLLAQLFWLKAYGQNNISHNNKQWFQLYVTVKPSNSNFYIKSDIGYRFEDLFKQKSQYLGRVGVGYKVKPELKTLLGFSYFGGYKNDTLSSKELRPYQELISIKELNKIRIQHRFRLEERFYLHSNKFDLRFRYRLFFLKKIHSWSKNDNSLSLYLNLGNEININIINQINTNIFNQNRILIGTEFRRNEIAISFIYNQELKSGNTSMEFTSSSVFWLGIKYKIKTKK